MHLHFLARIAWLSYTFAAVIALGGVAGVVAGNPRGWIPIGIAALIVLYQRLISKDAREADGDPRDTIG